MHAHARDTRRMTTDSNAKPTALGWTASIVAPVLALLLGLKSGHGREDPSPRPPAAVLTDRAADPDTQTAVAELGPEADGVEDPSQSCAHSFWEPFAAQHAGKRSASRKVWLAQQKTNADGALTTVSERTLGDDSWSKLQTDHLTQLANERAGKLTIETLVALLPDPIDSGLAYEYDTQLQALRLGIEAGVPHASADRSEQAPREASVRYQRDRDWLPWDDRNGGDARRVQSLACRRELPGVVLFRSAGGPERLLVLLIVGESPTAGPHYRALRHALALADSLAEPDSTRRILGPAFTGGASGLRRALDRHEHSQVRPRRATEIVSATANGAGLKTTLTDDHTRFHATTAPQSALECAFLHFTRALGSDPDEEDAAAHPSGRRHLDKVGILSESGTQFGDAQADGPCRYEPELALSFPLHVSELQREYERLDHGRETPSLMHPTALDISLLGDKRRDLETHQSAITKYAQDRALANVLSQISREGLEYLGIRATNVADAIFLARRVRDVAPDVRLAFFASDALLLHPEYQRHLLGSLVVTPYPFLGADDFSLRAQSSVAEPRHVHDPFESAAALGTFNAVLALRGAAPETLREYVYFPRAAGAPSDGKPVASHPTTCDHQPPLGLKPLPIWITTVSRVGLVPLRILAAVDCDDTIYGGAETPRALCTNTCTTEQRSSAWRRFNDFGPTQSATVHTGLGAVLFSDPRPLSIDPDVSPPHFWHFVLALLALATLLDFRSQRKMLCALGPAHPVTIPGRANTLDAALDLRFASAQWRLYALFRRITLTYAATYMLVIHLLATTVYQVHNEIPFLLLAACVAIALLVWTGIGMVRFWQSFAALRSMDALWEPPPPYSLAVLLDQGAALLSLIQPRGRRVTLRVSSSQLLVTFGLGMIATAGITWGVVTHIGSSTDLLSQHSSLTLFSLRSLPLLSGVSPAAPFLLCLAAIYVWTVGRCARTRLLRSLTVISPEDGVLDGVSTPIRSVLFPDSGTDHADGGFIRQERSLANALSRPSGGTYVITMGLIAFLPLMIFLLKRPSSLESRTVPMFAALGIIAVIVGVSLLQLLQYWRALDLVLKRIMVHPLGPAFRRVLPFMREPVDAQVSRLPNDVLRQVACAQAFETLVMLDRPNSIAKGIQLDASGSEVGPILPFSTLDALNGTLRLASDRTLAALTGPDLGEQATCEATLGRTVVSSACTLMEVLRAARQGRASGIDDANRTVQLKLPSIFPPGEERDVAAHDSTWLTRVEAYVATVVALLLNRHIRQFRIFLYTSTTCALLLLAAISSYPFEPQRTLMTCIWILMGAVVFSGLYVFVQLDRDPLLSHIAGHPESAGHLTLNSAFGLRVALWVVVPLLSVLAAQYPDIANGLAFWVEPFTRVLR